MSVRGAVLPSKKLSFQFCRPEELVRLLTRVNVCFAVVAVSGGEESIRVVTDSFFVVPVVLCTSTLFCGLKYSVLLTSLM